MDASEGTPTGVAGEAWIVFKITCAEWWRDDTFRFAASLAFYTIFSIAPILLIAVGTASLFLEREAAVSGIVAEVERMAGAQGAEAVRQVLEASRGFGKSLGAIATGGITFLLGASAVFAELQAALNRIWDVEANASTGMIRKLLMDRLRSFSIALVVGFLLLVSLVMSAVLTALQGYMEVSMPGVPFLWRALNVTVSFVGVALLFALIYKYLPDARIAWREVWTGAAVTSALFTFGKYFIGAYLGHTALGSAFGAAGSFAVLLVWIYYSALISFFGAEFTQVYARRRGSPIRPEAHARRVGAKPDAL